MHSIEFSFPRKVTLLYIWRKFYIVIRWDFLNDDWDSLKSSINLIKFDSVLFDLASQKVYNFLTWIVSQNLGMKSKMKVSYLLNNHHHKYSTAQILEYVVAHVCIYIYIYIYFFFHNKATRILFLVENYTFRKDIIIYYLMTNSRAFKHWNQKLLCRSTKISTTLIFAFFFFFFFFLLVSQL